MKAFILAGGFGTRLREVIHGRPKVLAPVHGRPFLEYVIHYLKQEGVQDIVLGVGYLAGYVRDAFGDGARLGVRLSYAEEMRPLGTAGAIANAAEHFEGDFLVLNGDTLVDVRVPDLLRFHSERQADVTIVTSTARHDRGGLVQLGEQDAVIRYEQRPERWPERAFTNAGMYVFRRPILDMVRAGERAFLETDLFPTLLQQDGRLFAFTAASDYIDIGSPERYEQARTVLKAIDAKR